MRQKIMEWGLAYIVTEDLRAWPLTDYKRTFRVVVDNGVWLELWRDGMKMEDHYGL